MAKTSRVESTVREAKRGAVRPKKMPGACQSGFGLHRAFTAGLLPDASCGDPVGKWSDEAIDLTPPTFEL